MKLRNTGVSWWHEGAKKLWLFEKVYWPRFVQDSYCTYNWISFDIADLQVSKSMQSKAQKRSNFKGSQGLHPWTTLRGLTATTRPQADKLLSFAQSLYPKYSTLNITYFQELNPPLASLYVVPCSIYYLGFEDVWMLMFCHFLFSLSKKTVSSLSWNLSTQPLMVW